MLRPSLTKRLVSRARPNHVTEDHADDWTLAQLREPAQKIAGRIQALAVGAEGNSVRQADWRVPVVVGIDRPVKYGVKRKS